MTAVAGEITVGIELYIPYSEVARAMKHPWYNRECTHAVAKKQSAHHAWTRVRAPGYPNVIHQKAALNKATKDNIRMYAQRIAWLSQGE